MWKKNKFQIPRQTRAVANTKPFVIFLISHRNHPVTDNIAGPNLSNTAQREALGMIQAETTTTENNQTEKAAEEKEIVGEIEETEPATNEEVNKTTAAGDIALAYRPSYPRNPYHINHNERTRTIPKITPKATAHPELSNFPAYKPFQTTNQADLPVRNQNF